MSRGASGSAGKWSDLGTRVGSAVVMVAIGGAGLWSGGTGFMALVAAVMALMAWELTRIASRMTRPGMGVAVCALLILTGGVTLVLLRSNLGLGWILWLILLVVATDIAGYFVGKLVGGPKFWPAVSPRKTWSGVIGGWLAAAATGHFFSSSTGVEWQLIALSVALSLASQFGDIFESALKRRAGLKDSSSLIPGHGGVLDRFDGLLGASTALLAVALLTGFPAGLLAWPFLP